MAGMSKRHFEGLAKIIEGRAKEASDDVRAWGAVKAVAGDIATMCQQENPQFDRARFLAACGLSGNGEG